MLFLCTASRSPDTSHMHAIGFVKEDECSCVLFHEEYRDPDNPEFRPSWHGTNVWNHGLPGTPYSQGIESHQRSAVNKEKTKVEDNS